MAGPSASSVRQPAVAGTFYPAGAEECRTQAVGFLRNGDPGEVAGGPVWIGGIVPHAGWICSGAIAGLTVSTLAAVVGRVDVVVVFGAVHTPLPIETAALDGDGQWAWPGGLAPVAAELRARLIEGSGGLFRQDGRFHAREHAVEVEVPLIELAWPDAVILPVEVPVVDAAVAIGRMTVQQVQAAGLRAVYLASSDLTHYGPSYGFAPAGLGLAALNWAKDNDRRLLQVVTDMAAERVVPEVRSRLSACGGGAIAAMMAACREIGASGARVLRHANSYEVLASIAPQSPHNAVGYAAVVVG